MADSEQFYSGKISLTVDFADQQLNFGFECNHFLIVHDGTGNITISWTGTTGSNDGDIEALDGFLALDGLEKSKVFVKTDNAGDKCRVFAWKGRS